VAGIGFLALVCLLGCLVAIKIVLKSPAQDVVSINELATSLTASIGKPIFRVFVVTKSIFVGDSTVHVDRSRWILTKGQLRSWTIIVQLSDHDVLSRWRKDTFAHLEVLWWLREYSRKRPSLNTNIYPVPNIIGGGLPKILNVNLPLDGRTGKLEQALLHMDVGSQLSPSSIPHDSISRPGGSNCQKSNHDERPGFTNRPPEPRGRLLRILCGIGLCLIGCALAANVHGRTRDWVFLGLSFLFLFAGGCLLCVEWVNGKQTENDHAPPHSLDTVPRQYSLTSPNLWGTVMSIGRMQMANILPMEKKVAVISALAEGSGIRQTERITGVNRETIMHLGVRVGQGCAALLDRKMRGLSCRHLQVDEIWGFIGKKERHLRPDDDPTLGDVWTFCAIDSDTKMVPSFKVGKRNGATANAFVADIKSRMANRVQISSDALREYVDAIELSFGSEVDFAQVIKTYTHDDSIIAERKFSAPEVVTTEKRRVIGHPNMRLASTSHVERLNGTTRLHMRRLTRLTYAFSKKLANFEAATALHFAYYNFVKRHNALRMTPAMAAGIERDFWTVGNLLEATV